MYKNFEHSWTQCPSQSAVTEQGAVEVHKSEVPNYLPETFLSSSLVDIVIKTNFPIFMHHLLL